jgi:hypothetical protein
VTGIFNHRRRKGGEANGRREGLAEEYERLKEEDPLFAEVRAKLGDVVLEERPEDGDVYNNDYRAFVDGYRRVKKAFFPNVNPVTVARTRKGDRDAAQELLVEMGVIDDLKRGAE